MPNGARINNMFPHVRHVSRPQQFSNPAQSNVSPISLPHACVLGGNLCLSFDVAVLIVHILLSTIESQP